jgi:hypothetical protein
VWHEVVGVDNPVGVRPAATHASLTMSADQLFASPDIAEAYLAVLVQKRRVRKDASAVLSASALLHESWRGDLALSSAKEDRIRYRTRLLKLVDRHQRAVEKYDMLVRRWEDLKNGVNHPDYEDATADGKPVVYIVTCGDGEICGVYTKESAAESAAYEVVEEVVSNLYLDACAEVRSRDELSRHNARMRDQGKPENQVFINTQEVQ